jgi:hypothetical protein
MFNIKYKVALSLFAITLVVYFLSYAGEGKNANYFVVLADAFLHGRINILENPPWLNELVTWQGKYYVVFPPMPAILLLPFVAIFGNQFPQPYLSILLGAANVSLSYLVFSKFFKHKIALSTAILYAFGTIQWYHAEVGSAWYFAHICAAFFLWLLILEVTHRKRLFLIGLLIGAAYLSRIPTILSFLFVLVYLYKDFTNTKIRDFPYNLKSFFLLGLGISVAVIFNALYDLIRFGVPYDIGYTLLPVLKEPWYKYGFVSINYIPIHLKEMLWGLPVFKSSPPYIIPNLFAMSIFLLTPAFILMFRARIKDKFILAAFISMIVIMIPELMHGGNGFSQFGYRHTLDVLPFMLILVASGMRDKLSWWIKGLIFISIIINLWGVIMISFLNIWTI